MEVYALTGYVTDRRAEVFEIFYYFEYLKFGLGLWS